MPKNALPVDANDTLAYLGGWMGGTIIPALEVATGVRDMIAAAINGDLIGVGIEFIGLIPGLGAAEDAKSMYNIPIKWAKAFPKSADEVFNLLKGAFLENIPASAREHILKFFGKSGDDVGSTVSKNKPTTIPEKRYLELAEKVGYSKKQMKRLVNDEGFTTADLEDFAKRDVDLNKVEALSKSGISNANVITLTKTDASLELAYRLSSRGCSGDQLVYLAKRGTDTNLKITLEQAETLKDIGYSAGDIVSISKNAKSKYVARVQNPVKGSNPKQWKNPHQGTGVTTDQLITLKQRGFSADEVGGFVEKGYSLKFANYLLEQGKSPQEVIYLFSDIRKTQFVVFLFGKCRDAAASNKAADRVINVGEHSFKPPQKCLV